MWIKFTFVAFICQLLTSANGCRSALSEVAQCKYKKIINSKTQQCHNHYSCSWRRFDKNRYSRGISREGSYLLIEDDFKYLKFSGDFCPELSHLSIMCNDLQMVDLINLPISITELSFAANSLRKIENLQRLLELSELSFIDIRFNFLTRFNLNYVPKTVKFLGLSDNEITEIDIKVLLNRLFKGNYFQIDLRRNPINCKCQNFQNNLKMFDTTATSCDYIECFVCNWLKTNEFYPNKLSTDFLFIVTHKHTYSCIPD